MIRAIDSGGASVIASSAQREAGPFVCAHCGSGAILKRGAIVAPHFAHEPDSNCPFDHENESPEHEAAKMEIFEALRARGVECDVEQRAGNRIADVLATIRGQRVAIEVQRSSLSPETIAARTADYTALGIAVIWLSYREDVSEFTNGNIVRMKALEEWLHHASVSTVHYFVPGQFPKIRAVEFDRREMPRHRATSRTVSVAGMVDLFALTFSTRIRYSCPIECLPAGPFLIMARSIEQTTAIRERERRAFAAARAEHAKRKAIDESRSRDDDERRRQYNAANAERQRATEAQRRAVADMVDRLFASVDDVNLSSIEAAYDAARAIGDRQAMGIAARMGRQWAALSSAPMGLKGPQLAALTAWAGRLTDPGKALVCNVTTANGGTLTAHFPPEMLDSVMQWAGATFAPNSAPISAPYSQK